MAVRKRKLSEDQAEVEEPRKSARLLDPAPATESGLAAWTNHFRSTIGRLTGTDADQEVTPVTNGATPTPKHFLKGLIADVKSQGGRMAENFGLLASFADTALFKGGLADDRQYQVGFNLL